MVEKKRKRKAPSSSPRKQRKRNTGSVETEQRSNWISSISSTYNPGLVSIRPDWLRDKAILPLTSLCLDAVLHLCFDLKITEPTDFTCLAPHLLHRLFIAIKETRPELLHSKLISDLFLEPNSDGALLLDDLPGVNAATFKAIPSTLEQKDKLSSLTRLVLAGQATINDAIFASLFRALKNARLEELNLRGCVKVSDKTVSALNKSRIHETLKTLNMNFTSPSPDGVMAFAAKCLDLEVLKLAGLGMGDKVGRWDIELQLNPAPFEKLRNLKFRAARMYLSDLKAVLRLCYETLETLDISFTSLLGTQIRGIDVIEGDAPTDPLLPFPPPQLTKLDISALPISCDRLLHRFIDNYEEKRRFNLENNLLPPKPMRIALNHADRANVMPLTDHVCTEAFLLQRSSDMIAPSISSRASPLFISRLSLQNQINIGKSGQWMIARALSVIRDTCEELNLSGTSIDAEAIAGISGTVPEFGELMGYLQAVPRDSLSLLPQTYEINNVLKVLRLDRTRVDKIAMPAIAHCSALRELSLAKTTVSASDIYVLLNDLDNLELLDLTACRDIDIEDRRCFFEKWIQERDPEKSYVRGTEPYQKGSGTEFECESV